MKHEYFLAIFLLVCTLCPAQSADEVVDRYIAYFNDGDLKTKQEVVRNAIALRNPEMGPFYQVVIDYAIYYPEEINRDSGAWKMISDVLYQIEKLVYLKAGNSVTRLFMEVKLSTIQLAALNTLSKTGKGDSGIIANLNMWLDKQNTLFRSRSKPDFKVVHLCIQTLGIFGDKTSFPPVFTAMILKYSDSISKTALETLQLLQGTFKDNLIKVIETRDVFNKRGAFVFALEYKDLDEKAKKDISRAALKTSSSVNMLTGDEKKILADLRYRAIIAVSNYKLGDMTEFVIEHFNSMKLEYDNGRETNIHMIEGIDCLGNMGTHEAAVVLAGYLDFVNTSTEKKKVFDQQIVLALINNLVKLGDKVAIDPLQYVVFLNYSNKIKQAAKDAVTELNKR